MTPFLCAFAVVIILETKKCRKRHLSPSNISLQRIATNRNGFRRTNEGHINKQWGLSTKWPQPWGFPYHEGPAGQLLQSFLVTMLTFALTGLNDRIKVWENPWDLRLAATCGGWAESDAGIWERSNCFRCTGWDYDRRDPSVSSTSRKTSFSSCC